MKSVLLKRKKKAWLRIIEAFVAIMIILGAVLIVLSKQTKKTDISRVVYEKQADILELIANNESLRNNVLDGKNEKINKFISLNIPNNWNFTTRICSIENICNSDETPNDREVYVSETIISANLTDYPNKKTKKIRFFIWGK